MVEIAAERRLAAIVAVDVAGYSARTEADAAGAVRAVQALSRRVGEAASRHGGRVFNTAGDGFMLEFPTVSGALEAAAAIAAAPEPLVRVGVHLGEVTVAPGGDLLGHGVNVAARLQARAAPGTVMVSDAARRMLGGGGPLNLKPKGRVRLDKMNEVTPVFVLQPQGGSAPAAAGRTRAHRPLAWAAALLALAAVLVAAVFVWRAQAPEPLKIEVGAFTAPAAGPGKVLAQSLPGELTSLLTASQAQTVTAGAPGPKARLLVEGEVAEVGPVLRVRVRLTDREAGMTLWTGVDERPIAQADTLQSQSAARVADIVGRAAKALGPKAGKIAPQTLAAFLKLLDQFREGVAATDSNIELERQIVAAAPDFSYARANLAFDLALAAGGRQPEAAAEMRAEARREARKALKQNPAAGDAYGALIALDQYRSSKMPLVQLPADLVRGEALIAKALAAVPSDPGLQTYMGSFLRGVGRLRESIPYYRGALAVDPYSPAKTAGMVFALAGQGQWMEAKTLSDRGLILFPDYPTVRRGAAYTAILYGPPEDALLAIDATTGRGGLLEPEIAALWRDYVNTVRRGRPDKAVLARLAKAADSGRADMSTAVSALSLAGEVDEAFRLTNKAFDQRMTFYPANLFEGATRNMRRDPRFLDLARRLDLPAYWSRTGHWPDFCAEPDLPYDCRTGRSRAAVARAA